MRNDPHIQQGVAHEFACCTCTKEETVVHKACCVTPKGNFFTVGRSWASSLSGFIAGAVAASLVLIPWLLLLAKLCPTGPIPT